MSLRKSLGGLALGIGLVGCDRTPKIECRNTAYSYSDAHFFSGGSVECDPGQKLTIEDHANNHVIVRCECPTPPKEPPVDASCPVTVAPTAPPVPKPRFDGGPYIDTHGHTWERNALVGFCIDNSDSYGGISPCEVAHGMQMDAGSADTLTRPRAYCEKHLADFGGSMSDCLTGSAPWRGAP